MQEKCWFSSLFDIFGILSLICAVIALGGALWFVDISSESLQFKAFHVCLATGITSFLVGRLVDIFLVITNTPDPRSLRTRPAADTNVATGMADVADGDTVREGKFPRAA